jgi:hypothetical protein
MSLADDQALMGRAIRWPTGVADFLAKADANTRAAFTRAFAETPALDRVARVGVYAEAYFWRLHGVLLDHFGLVAWLLGTARFHNLVTDYVLACPSIDPDIRRYGERFPAFVATHADAGGFADVAAIEWAMVRALDAPDEPSATVDDLRAVPLEDWPALELCAVATARVRACALPFTACWQAHANAPAPAVPPATIDPPTHVLVWRAGLDVLHRELEPDEARAIAALITGIRFDALCEAIGSADTVVAWLQRWLADDLVAALRRAGPPRPA